MVESIGGDRVLDGDVTEETGSVVFVRFSV